METENQKLRERVEELSRETMLLAHTVTDLTAKLKLATSAAPQPVDAAQAVKYRFVTFNGPAVDAAGMNLKYNDNGTITAWPITDLSITKDAP